jgi:hypothetical protein
MRKYTKMEGIIMTVEKFIRILGYVVYAALWSPVIVLALIVLPIAYVIMFKSVKVGLVVYWNALKYGISHDKQFIDTGVWY